MKKNIKKSTSLKKMQDAGPVTPDGRLKSNKVRNIEITPYGSKADVTKTRPSGKTVTKTVTTSRGFVPTADKTKTVTDKAGNVISKKTKSVPYNRGERMTDRVINNVGRNINDTWAFKKGGTTNKSKKRK